MQQGNTTAPSTLAQTVTEIDPHTSMQAAAAGDATMTEAIGPLRIEVSFTVS